MVISRDHKIDVWGKPQTVTVYQKSKSVWIAVGDCMGERLEVKGRSELQALGQWRDAARYKSG